MRCAVEMGSVAITYMRDIGHSKVNGPGYTYRQQDDLMRILLFLFFFPKLEK
jgi:hypothetical protein